LSATGAASAQVTGVVHKRGKKTANGGTERANCKGEKVNKIEKISEN